MEVEQGHRAMLGKDCEKGMFFNVGGRREETGMIGWQRVAVE